MTRPFISYAREDLQSAIQLRNDLVAHGAQPWMDRFDLLGGQDWSATISDALQQCTHFVALISCHSVNKRGFVQRELREALRLLDELPPNAIFVIPVRVDASIPGHSRLRELHWIDLFPKYGEGLNALLRSLGLVEHVSVNRSNDSALVPYHGSAKTRGMTKSGLFGELGLWGSSEVENYDTNKASDMVGAGVHPLTTQSARPVVAVLCDLDGHKNPTGLPSVENLGQTAATNVQIEDIEISGNRGKGCFIKIDVLRPGERREVAFDAPKDGGVFRSNFIKYLESGLESQRSINWESLGPTSYVFAPLHIPISVTYTDPATGRRFRSEHDLEFTYAKHAKVRLLRDGGTSRS